jgi:hypothetical protein
MLTVDENGSKRLSISHIEDHQGDRLPAGDQVNPELADPESALRREALSVIKCGGSIDLGRMRVFSGGGFYRLPANLIDLSCDMGTHEQIWGKICSKMGGEPMYAFPAVFRDWGAPGTCGVIEGGGAGRGDFTPTSAAEFLVRRCMGENFGEIGIQVYASNGEFGRLGYDISPRLKSMRVHNDWLHDHVVDEWRKAHGQVPTAFSFAEVSLKSLPDAMDISGVGEVHGVQLAFEWHSASVECLVQNELDINLRREARFRFLDLESRGVKNGNGSYSALNRRIIVVLQRGDQLMAISYLHGMFDPNFPAMPIIDQTVNILGNDKFAAMIRAIRS